MPVVICDVESGESMITEKGSMCWMSPNMEMKTSAGGIGKAWLGAGGPHDDGGAVRQLVPQHVGAGQLHGGFLPGGGVHHAEKKDQLESSGQGNVIMSYEESYGYMLGSYVRDKDAVTAAVALTEMAAYYAGKGMTLYDALLAL